jgi:excisionase family DNA binding protein
MDARELLTADEVAKRLRLQPCTIQKWARCGRIPAIHLTSKVVRFDMAAVIAAIRNKLPESVAP